MTDKFTPELWLTTTPAEDYLRAEEGFSLPASVALVKQVGVIGTSGTKLLDLGTGLGQITQTIMEQTSGGAVQVVTADKDEGLLDVVRGKNEARGWGDLCKWWTPCLPFPDNHFDFVLASFLYFLLPDPIKGLTESLRTLKPGGALGFTTWAYNRPWEIVEQAQALIPSFPNTRTVEFHTRMSANGYWGSPAFVRSTLEGLGLVDIKIEPAMWVHGGNSPVETAKMMWLLYKIKAMMAFGGPNEMARVEGWKLFDKLEQVLRAEFGDGPAKVSTVALIITARKPE